MRNDRMRKRKNKRLNERKAEKKKSRMIRGDRKQKKR